MSKKLYQVLNSRLWDTIWIISGIILVVISTILSSKGHLSLTTVTSFMGSIIGMTVVLLLANQTGKLATGLGIIGALLDTFNNYKFGLSGMMLVGIYAFFLYTKGFLTMGKQIEVTKVTKSNLYISAVIAIGGGLILYFFGSTILPANAPTWVISANILVFIIQVVSQYLMVEGKAIGWVGFCVINIINLFLQTYIIISGNNPTAVIYLVMTFMFLLNSIKAVVLWFGYGE
ncbi:nicotinamide mononucleotide transporter [Vagococcus vulneris]|uniref:Nicotinamide mononucleotide transporter n=1 Tax=Vagococcus vulneris TaxID=1977869 RepID=A0A429ZWH9_9ENTE|nr:nicotinamide mononucleotide transporter [Vagococcus vulneris]RST98132.1 hypothetical protein CBF37_08850 [Vagococcus vulneris]